MASDNSAGAVLVTGGAGYIGSHTVIELLNSSYDVVVIDNCSNAVKGENCKAESIRRVEKITSKTVHFYDVDLLDMDTLKSIFKKHKIFSVIHFAGLKAVGESNQIPLKYYRVNITGTLNLLDAMKEFGVSNIVFSSSATVYGSPDYLPIDEKHPAGQNLTNCYGRTKYFLEQILTDVYSAEKDWNVVILRYFNPVGSHKSGEIGEDPSGIPNNLMPYVAQVAGGRRDTLQVFGKDYDTLDGTGVRDYIHVIDLASGHLAALNKVKEKCGLKVYNLGSGVPYSVLQMVTAFEKASGKKINYKIAPRRSGDLASIYADASLAEKELNWKASRGLDEMCEDLWRWQVKNPKGFASK